MGHYAKVVNNKVVDVIVAEEEFFETFIDLIKTFWFLSIWKHFISLSLQDDKTLIDL